jgi:hypothetical protein
MNGVRRAAVPSFVAALVASVVVSAAAGATDGRPTVGDRDVRLRVVDQSFGIGGDNPFTATIELTGTAAELAEVSAAVHDTPASSETNDDDAAAGSTVRVRAHAAIAETAQLAALDADGPGPVVDTMEVPAADVFADRDAPVGTVTAVVDPGGADGLDLPATGIYPITIEVVVRGEPVAGTMTFVERFDPEAVSDSAPLAVSIMAGVADPGPWPSPMELSSASIEVAKMIDLAEAVDGPISISLPPSLVTALADADTAPADTTETSVPDTTGSPETTVLAGTPGITEPAFTGLDSDDAFRDAFRGDELIALPAIALDPSSITAVALNGVFTDQLRTGEDLLVRASPRAVVSRAVWYSRGTVSASAMVALRNLGIRMLVVPDSTANELGVSTGTDASGLFAVNLIADGTLPAMTVSGLGAQLETPVGGDPSTAANEAAVRLLVELQLQHAASGAPAVVLATPRATVPDPAITAQFVDLATELPDVSIVALSRLPGVVDGALAGGPTAPVELPPTAGPDLSERLLRVAEARIDAAHAELMLTEPARAGEWDDDLGRVMSTAIDDATAFDRLDATHAEIERVLGAIVPPPSETLRLTGTSSRLRLRLENTYDQPLNVLIDVRSPKLTFPEADPLVSIPAGESVLVDVPVQARSNGTFTIEVDVLSPDRARLADPVILKARVTRLTGLSQVVTGASALVLVSWWYSHIRRSRRRRHDARDPEPPFGEARVAVSPDAAEAMVRATPTGLESRPADGPVSGTDAGPPSDSG